MSKAETPMVISVGRIFFQLDRDKHTVRFAEAAARIAEKACGAHDCKAAYGDTPLKAGLLLQAEVVRYLTAAVGTGSGAVDLSAFCFTTQRSPIEDGLLWKDGGEYLTRVPVVVELKGIL